MPPLPEDGPIFSITENLPGSLFYIPPLFYWLYLSVRFGGLMVPTSTNPSIVLGGLCGESKTDVFSLFGPFGRAHLAPFVTITIDGGEDEVVRAQDALTHAGIAFPVVAKPDIGRNGRGVKIVRTPRELGTYLASFPKGQGLMLQRYIEEEGEAGVFYVRRPKEEKGRITSLTLKYFPKVIGDGTASVRELIARDQRASKIAPVYFRRIKRDLDRVPAKGEVYRLVSVGNHVRGAIFADGAPYITQEMTDAFDRISKEIPEFYFGRFDVRFGTIEDLKAGRNFYILECNGSGSEPTHIYDRRATLREAYRSIFGHWKLAFSIGAENRARGARAASVWEVLRAYRDELALLNVQPDEE